MLKLLQGPFRIYKNLLHKDHLYKDPAGFGRTLKIKKGKRRKDKKKTMHSNMCVGESNFGSAWGLLGRPSKGDLLLEPYTGQGDLLKRRGFVKETFCRSCLLTCVRICLLTCLLTCFLKKASLRGSFWPLGASFWGSGRSPGVILATWRVILAVREASWGSF